MRRLLIPAITVSFLGAICVASLPLPPARTVAAIHGASITSQQVRATMSSAALSPAVLAQLTGHSLGQSISRSLAAPLAHCGASYSNRPAQVLVVKASGTRATLIGCSRRGSGYRATLGPFPARVGYHGVAPPGAKREGDGRTPGGTFALGPGFGSARSPGLRQGWLPAGARDVWVDDPHSALYNTHQRLPAHGRWRSAERLAIPAYRYAQVIRYNTGAIPGLGSAIFMHVGNTPTSGCVALATHDLLTVMRWERPGAVMVIS